MSSIEERSNDIKQPLGLYDVFGYLLPGFFFYAIFIIDFDGANVIRYYFKEGTIGGIENANISLKIKYFLNFIYYNSSDSFGVIPFIVFLIFCYLTGHLMASFSSFVSKHIAKRLLLNPSENLFKIEGTIVHSIIYRVIRWILIKVQIKDFISKAFSYAFGDIFSLNYKKPFDAKFIAKFKEKINLNYGYEVNPNDYYWLTYSYICANHPGLVRRIQHFVNLDGFARNIAGTFIFYLLFRILFLFFYAKCTIDHAVVIILVTYLVTAFVMFWTYLRLHKRQAVDMFYMYLSLKE